MSSTRTTIEPGPAPAGGVRRRVRGAAAATVIGLTALALAAAALPVAAADPSPLPAGAPTTGVVAFGCDAFVRDAAAGASAEVAVGAPLLVTLCAQPATGYRWSPPVVADPGVAAVRSWAYTPPADPLPGASGVERFLVVGTAPGTTTLTFSYDRPWAGGDTGARVATVALVVRAADVTPAASGGPDRAAAAACCAASIVAWGWPVIVEQGGVREQIVSGTGRAIAADGDPVTVTWWQGAAAARVQVWGAEAGYRVRWTSVDGGAVLWEGTLTSIGQEVWATVAGRNVQMSLEWIRGGGSGSELEVALFD